MDICRPRRQLYGHGHERGGCTVPRLSRCDRQFDGLAQGAEARTRYVLLARGRKERRPKRRGLRPRRVCRKGLIADNADGPVNPRIGSIRTAQSASSAARIIGSAMPERLRALVYRPGSLGDTLVSLPAIAEIRRQYPDHRLTLLTEGRVARSPRVSPWSI